jgi:hypothetical protein
MRKPAAVADSVIKVAFERFGPHGTPVKWMFVVPASEADAARPADAKHSADARRRSTCAFASVASA